MVKECDFCCNAAVYFAEDSGEGYTFYMCDECKDNVRPLKLENLYESEQEGD